jgi:hypothetical protein
VQVTLAFFKDKTQTQTNVEAKVATYLPSTLSSMEWCVDETENLPEAALPCIQCEPACTYSTNYFLKNHPTLNSIGRSKNSNLPSFPGHGSSAEELQAVMGTEEQVSLPWPLEYIKLSSTIE